MFLSRIQKYESVIEYEYDDLGQLITEHDVTGGSMTTYSYDKAGNLLSKRFYYKNPDTGEYSAPNGSDDMNYSSSEWGDLMTSWCWQTIEYDGLGNPLSYCDGASTYEFTWEGRRLIGVTQYDKEISFTYNDEGLRTSKTVNDVTTFYYWSGTQLVAEVTPSSVLVYLYEADGSPLGFKYLDTTDSANAWEIYWFEKNLFGDIVAVYDASGTKLVSYKYDAWGSHPTTYYNGGKDTAAVNNNLRYRGYFYDTDLRLYYLQSRYYSPLTSRFINADSYISTGQGILAYNMFAYCNNNPIMYVDYTGCLALTTLLIGAAIVLVSGFVGGSLGAMSALTTGENVLESAIEGCINGMISSACGLVFSNPLVAAGAAFAVALLVDISIQSVNQYEKEKSLDLTKIDYARSIDTGIQTAISAAIPAYGKGALDAVDAFGTALIWSETSAIMTSIDIILTNIRIRYAP